MKRTDQTLLQQLQITDVEIKNRKELLYLTDCELDLLFKYKDIVQENIDQIVDAFYEKQIEFDEISLLIGDADTLDRLRSAQKKYVLDLFSGNYDTEYVNNRLRIGMVHKRIGVEPKLYLSAVRTLKMEIFSVLKLTNLKGEELSQVLCALDKLLNFDTTLVFDTYIGSLLEEIEAERNKALLYAKSLEEKVAERTQQLEKQVKLDTLTSLFNQGAMRDMLKRELAVARRHKHKLSLVYFDVDDFKKVNDNHGHLFGDKVLKNLGKCISGNIRETDIPCRYGGDEFCIVLPECDVNCAKTICQKIIDTFIEQYPYYSLSFGIAETGIDEFLTEDQLIRIADENMYKAKKAQGIQIYTV